MKTEPQSEFGFSSSGYTYLLEHLHTLGVYTLLWTSGYHQLLPDWAKQGPALKPDHQGSW